jgi:hypothetical protein
MKFLVVGNFFDISQKANFQKLHEAEGKALWELYGAGILQEALFGKDFFCLSFVVECHNLNEAEHFMKMLPSAKADLIKYQVSEMTVFPALTEQFLQHHSKLPIWMG